MTWGYIAVAAVSAVAANVQHNRASSDSKAARAAAKNQLEFDQQRYYDWQAAYGSIQDNLSEYYNQLTPEYYAAVGLEAFQQEREAALTRLNESLAQRGLAGGAIETSLEAQEAIDAAETRAQIRRDAPNQVAAEKLNFLQVGLGINPAQSVSNTLAQRASTAAQYAQQSEAAAGQAVGSAISTAATALSAYNRQNTQSTLLPADNYTDGLYS